MKTIFLELMVVGRFSSDPVLWIFDAADTFAERTQHAPLDEQRRSLYNESNVR